MERTEKKAKVLEVELPERLAEALEELVSAGWFKDEAELARTALSEFVRHHKLELQEQFQREDIQWALELQDRSD